MLKHKHFIAEGCSAKAGVSRKLFPQALVAVSCCLLNSSSRLKQQVALVMIRI